jgi:hypothetical protein
MSRCRSADCVENGTEADDPGEDRADDPDVEIHEAMLERERAGGSFRGALLDGRGERGAPGLSSRFFERASVGSCGMGSLRQCSDVPRRCLSCTDHGAHRERHSADIGFGFQDLSTKGTQVHPVDRARRLNPA